MDIEFFLSNEIVMLQKISDSKPFWVSLEEAIRKKLKNEPEQNVTLLNFAL